MPQNYQYIPLSFITDFNEIKRQVINTVAITFLLNEKRRTTILNFYLENTQYGYTASALGEGTHRLLRITDINSGKVDWGNVPFCDCSEGEKYLLKKNDVLVARTGGTTGKSFLIENVPANAVFASYLIRLRTNQKCLPDFLNIYLNSYVFWSQISEMKSGSAQPNVNAEKLKTLVIPECSIDEQRKIISICRNENTGYYDSFVGRLKDKIEKIVAALDKNELISNELLQQQTYLQLLRQTILQEAVQGKLTQQNPADEPASELLKRIKAEKQKLIKEGKLKKEKELPTIMDEEIPFKLPKGWIWCRLGELVTIMDAGWSPACIETAAPLDKWGVLKTTAVQQMEYLEVENKELPSKLTPKEQYEVKSGDILFTRAGPFNRVGVCCLVEDTRSKLMISDKIIRFHLFDKNVSPKFITLCLNTGASKAHIESKKSGMALSQVNISQDNLKLTPIPLPPLAEQQRIVAKIHQLQQQLSQLEAQVQQSRQYAQQLLQSVLKEAFDVKEKVYVVNEEYSLAAEE